MAAPANGLLPGYPNPQGNGNESVMTFAGPASYTQIGIANPPTGGIVIKASDLGLVDMDQACVWGSEDGQFGANLIFPGNPQGPVSSVTIQIVTLATRAEVGGATNLSTHTFRIWAKGRD